MTASILTTCSIPAQTLHNSPFSLTWGSTVSAVIIATNSYGNSSASAVGTGAIILTVPDAPTNVANVVSITG
jgi:hypothetical protein